MVTMGSRGSRRGGQLLPGRDGRRARASASTLSGKMRGNWCLRIIISTSTPKSSGSPRISMTRPMGGRVGVGQLVISTSTTRPSRSSWPLQAVTLDERVPRCQARDAGWRLQARGREFLRRRDEDGLGHALVEGNDDVLPVAAIRIARSETCRRRWGCGVRECARCGPACGRRLWAARLRRAPGRPAWRR